MVVTDFDGTLRQSKGEVSNADLETLVRLGSEGYVRVVATGRSLFSLFRAIDTEFPIDYVIFSSGVGVQEFKTQRIIRKTSLNRNEILAVWKLLEPLNLDYMIHAAVPDNHEFFYRCSGKANSDFDARLELYAGYHRKLNEPPDIAEATQFVIIDPDPDALTRLQKIRGGLTDLEVVRTTSPLDGRAVWTEILPAKATKGRAAGWLANKLEIERETTVAIGNDFNDWDLLEWGTKSYVVADAPDPLRKTFTPLNASAGGALTESVHTALGL